MYAARHGHVELVKLLLDMGHEEVISVDSEGTTVLMIAAMYNQEEYMLSISADIDNVDNEGNSALHHASAWGHTAVMDLLAGCNVDLENKFHFTAADYAYSFGVQEHIRGTFISDSVQ
ncbi:hypothetical protein DFQ28_008758 [Apophysomyces sp. BC1034]|nr:hypothetical protein DFQ28_008758 [Apophysomyces sp. BC1034]